MNDNNAGPLAGKLFISNDVIASIALNAAKDVEGFSGLSSPLGKARSVVTGKEKRAIEVKTADGGIDIGISVRLKSGAGVQNTVRELQLAVKNTVQSMTGTVVKSVNVTVDDIVFDE